MSGFWGYVVGGECISRIQQGALRQNDEGHPRHVLRAT